MQVEFAGCVWATRVLSEWYFDEGRQENSGIGVLFRGQSDGRVSIADKGKPSRKGDSLRSVASAGFGQCGSSNGEWNLRRIDWRHDQAVWA